MCTIQGDTNRKRKQKEHAEEDRKNKTKILLPGKGILVNCFNAVNGAGAQAVVGYLPKFDTEYDGTILCVGDNDPKYYKEERTLQKH